MPGKTSLFILLIFSILYLQSTPKIYDTPEVNVVYTTINVSFTVTASGGMPALFITNGEQPDFSPDGSTVAFTRDNNIYTVPSAGGGESLWISNASHPAYSPDGTLIAYTTYGSRKDIYFALISNLDVVSQLTAAPYQDIEALWRLDGSGVIFSRLMEESTIIDPYTNLPVDDSLYHIYLASNPSSKYMINLTMDQSTKRILCPHFLIN